MAQHIGCQIVNENGKIIKESNLNFAAINQILWDVDEEKKKYQWLLTIDEYGDTVFNYLQTPIIIAELEKLINEVSQEYKHQINEFIEFIKSIGNHEYIKFIGD